MKKPPGERGLWGGGVDGSNQLQFGRDWILDGLADLDQVVFLVLPAMRCRRPLE